MGAHVTRGGALACSHGGQGRCIICVGSAFGCAHQAAASSGAGETASWEPAASIPPRADHHPTPAPTRVPPACAVSALASRGQKVCVEKDEVLEELAVDELRLKQVQVEASFSQPNGGMCQNMLSWARSVTGGRAGWDSIWPALRAALAGQAGPRVRMPPQADRRPDGATSHILLSVMAGGDEGVRALSLPSCRPGTGSSDSQSAGTGPLVSAATCAPPWPSPLPLQPAVPVPTCWSCTAAMATSRRRWRPISARQGPRHAPAIVHRGC